MKGPNQPPHLSPMMREKQQLIDFGQYRPWIALSPGDQRACREAIAALLFQVTTATFDSSNELKDLKNPDGSSGSIPISRQEVKQDE